MIVINTLFVRNNKKKYSKTIYQKTQSKKLITKKLITYLVKQFPNQISIGKANGFERTKGIDLVEFVETQMREHEPLKAFEYKVIDNDTVTTSYPIYRVVSNDYPMVKIVKSEKVDEIWDNASKRLFVKIK